MSHQDDNCIIDLGVMMTFWVMCSICTQGVKVGDVALFMKFVSNNCTSLIDN